MRTLIFCLFILLARHVSGSELYFFHGTQDSPKSRDMAAWNVVKDSLKGEISFLEDHLGIPVVPVNITGYSSQYEVTRKIQSYPIGSDDIVIFYYWGHGSDSTNGPLGSVRIHSGKNDRLDLNVVERAIHSKSPRLSVFMGDCCNAYSSNFGGDSWEVNTARHADSGKRITRNVEAYRRLFLGSRGSIKVASAKEGTKAVYDSATGSYFLTKYLELLENPRLNDYTSWEDYLQKLEVNIGSFCRTRSSKTIQDPFVSVQVARTSLLSTTNNRRTFAMMHIPRLNQRFSLGRDFNVYTSGGTVVGKWQSQSSSQVVAKFTFYGSSNTGAYSGSTFDLSKIGSVTVANEIDQEVGYWENY